MIAVLVVIAVLAMIDCSPSSAFRFVRVRSHLFRYADVPFAACIVRMFSMREVHLRNLDLNLLGPLHALLEERHVTRAAKRSFLSQPATSRALERLREMLRDPLLVRSGRASARTVRGSRV